jgi:hypothetical protein
MTETQELRYRERLQDLSTVENYRMRLSLRDNDDTGRGGRPDRIPETLISAAKVLASSGSLTSADLAWKMDKTPAQARALLDRLQKSGLATSEYHCEGRARIYHFNKPRL